MHSGDIELAVAMLLDYRKHIIVPNVCLNWGVMECDMLMLDEQNRITEIEIKISMSDLKADFKKAHKHNHPNISRLIYAFPKTMLEKALPLIPKHCGIITVDHYTSHIYQAQWYRQCRHSKDKKPLTNGEALNLTRLGCMRIWTLKRHNNATKTRYQKN